MVYPVKSQLVPTIIYTEIRVFVCKETDYIL